MVPLNTRQVLAEKLNCQNIMGKQSKDWTRAVTVVSKFGFCGFEPTFISNCREIGGPIHGIFSGTVLTIIILIDKSSGGPATKKNNHGKLSLAETRRHLALSLASGFCPFDDDILIIWGQNFECIVILTRDVPKKYFFK